MLRQLIQSRSACIPTLVAARSASVTGGLSGGHTQVQFFFEHAPWFLRLHSQPTRGGAGCRFENGAALLHSLWVPHMGQVIVPAKSPSGGGRAGGKASSWTLWYRNHSIVRGKDRGQSGRRTLGQFCAIGVVLTHAYSCGTSNQTCHRQAGGRERKQRACRKIGPSQVYFYVCCLAVAPQKSSLVPPLRLRFGVSCRHRRPRRLNTAS